LREVELCGRKLLASETVSVYREGGTMLLAGAGGPDGNFPQGVRNDQDSYWPRSKSHRISEPELKRCYEVRRLGCFNCPIYCSHYYAVPDGPYAGTAGEGFEINSANAFGSNLDIDDPAAILRMHTLCNRMGLDVDMAGTVLAFAFEAFQRGHLSREEANGLDLTWGNHQAAVALLQAVNEPSARLMKAWGLGVALSTHGGGHLDGSPHPSAWGGHEDLASRLFGNPRPGAPGDYNNQSLAVIWHENYKAVVDMLGICYYTSMWPDAGSLTADDYARLLAAGTGQEFSGEELMLRGRRLRNLQKAFNTLHTGAGRAADRLPRRFAEPIASGPHTGERLDPDRWEAMLDEYYMAQGWDLATGWQTEASLRSCGLDEAIDKLRMHGRLPGSMDSSR
jgi:aldehyde:ferredoxin oxidoreductase